MSTATSPRTARKGTTEAAWVRYTLIGIALLFMALFLVLPLAAVFTRRCARASTPTGKH
jgi:sulfate transport system permease protein